MAKKLVKVWPDIAEHLADRFWPGPLTMVLPKNESVSALISSGLETVGLRCPNHPLTLNLIEQLKVPLAAPSANKFGKTSPTKAEHVADEFPEERVAILDGGSCQIGLESTVHLVRPSGELSILRPGAVSQSEIAEVLESKKIPFQFVEVTDKKESPGHMKHHYMPSVPLIAVHRGYNASDVQGERPYEVVLSSDVRQAFREFYQKLRDGAESGADVLWIQWKPEWDQEIWLPLVDRLTKAATLIVK
jgi:L-threonylcarbamoyladenylate synthase